MIFLMLKARKAKHPLGVEYTQPSGRRVMRVMGKNGKSKVVPVKKKKSKKKTKVTKYEYGQTYHMPLSIIEAAAGGQMRTEFDPKELRNLANSIQYSGQVQPILVRPHPTKKGKYEIVAGERRFRAISMLGDKARPRQKGLNTIRAEIEDPDDTHKHVEQVVENIQRVDPSAIDIANSLKKMKDSGDSFEDIARQVGKRIDYVINHHSLTELIPDVQKMILRKDIPKTAGYILAKLPQNEQGVFAGKYINEKWSPRTLDNHVFNHLNQQKLFEAGAEKTDEMKHAEEELKASGKSPEEVNDMIRNFVGKYAGFIDKFIEDGGARLSAYGMMASGTLDQNLKLFEMLSAKLTDVIGKMKTAHYETSTPSMFAKSISMIKDKNTMAQLERDFSILKSLLRYKKRNAN